MLLVSMPSLHRSPLRQRGKNTFDTPSTDAAWLCNCPDLLAPSPQQLCPAIFVKVTMHQHFRRAGCQQCTSGPDKVSWHQRSPATMQAETPLATCVCVCHWVCVFLTPQRRSRWDSSMPTVPEMWAGTRQSVQHWQTSSVLNRLDAALSSLPLSWWLNKENWMIATTKGLTSLQIQRSQYTVSSNECGYWN